MCHEDGLGASSVTMVVRSCGAAARPSRHLRASAFSQRKDRGQGCANPWCVVSTAGSGSTDECPKDRFLCQPPEGCGTYPCKELGVLQLAEKKWWKKWRLSPPVMWSGRMSGGRGAHDSRQEPKCSAPPRSGELGRYASVPGGSDRSHRERTQIWEDTSRDPFVCARRKRTLFPRLQMVPLPVRERHLSVTGGQWETIKPIVSIEVRRLPLEFLVP